MPWESEKTTRFINDGRMSPISIRQGPSATAIRFESELTRRYDAILKEPAVNWPVEYRMQRLLGAGGQGVVYLCDRLGMDGFSMPVALKMFSPQRFASEEAYELDMARIARVASRIALIQQDHLLDMHNFVEYDGIRVLVMEWVDGFDLEFLLDPLIINETRNRVSSEQWAYFNKVVFLEESDRVRLQPGVANAIIRECLAALAALHREGIVHADIKPSNIMVKRTGNAKLIDTGAAFEIDSTDTPRFFTPRYAAPEVLRGGVSSPSSDLASLGYVLIELLSGVHLFEGLKELDDILRAKEQLVDRLFDILPDEISQSDVLVGLIKGLVAADPRQRFPSAEAADLFKTGAASFNRQLVVGNLASEFEADLRSWMQCLP